MKNLLTLTMMIIMLLTLSSCKLSMHIDDEIDDWDKVESWIMNTDGTGKTLVPCGYEAYLSPDNQKLRVYTSYDGIYEYDLFGNKTKLADTPNLWFYSVAANQEKLIANELQSNHTYLTNGYGLLVKDLTTIPDRHYSVFKFLPNGLWLWGASYSPFNNSRLIHLFHSYNDMEYTISDTVGMGPPCFDGEQIAYYNRLNGNNFSLIKHNVVTNEKYTLLNSSSKINLLFLSTNKDCLVYYINLDLYTYNLLTNEIKYQYSFNNQNENLFMYMQLHSSKNQLFFVEKDLKKLDLLTGECTVLATGNIEFASLSPDGSKIYYITKTHIEKDE